MTDEPNLKIWKWDEAPQSYRSLYDQAISGKWVVWVSQWMATVYTPNKYWGDATSHYLNDGSVVVIYSGY